ncbi:hypothetical protein [Saccharopolyspora cebuensis]|uniref:Uncharacterized protein n=1 Tax=Saccharopolyspora cebuensis TaxID=418759 RepID=A0ABV4CGB4_9PSEU
MTDFGALARDVELGHLALYYAIENVGGGDLEARDFERLAATLDLLAGKLREAAAPGPLLIDGQVVTS